MTVGRYLHKEIPYKFSIIGGDGTARASDGPAKFRRGTPLKEVICKTSVYAIFYHLKNACFFTSKLNNRFLATIYKDYEPQHVPNDSFKHFFHRTCVKPTGSLLLGNSEQQNVPNDSHTYLHKDMLHIFFYTFGGDGTARPLWRSDQNWSGKSSISILNTAIYVKRICITWRLNMFFTSKLENQLIATIYKDSEPQKTPNVCLKHVLHNKYVKPMVFSFLVILNFKTLQMTVRWYFQKEITYKFSSMGGDGTAGIFWPTDENSTGKYIKLIFHTAIYVKRIFSSGKHMCLHFEVQI